MGVREASERKSGARGCLPNEAQAFRLVYSTDTVGEVGVGCLFTGCLGLASSSSASLQAPHASV